MPVTLASAQQNATEAMDLSIINEFRKNQIADLLTFDDVVNPAGGGATLSYGYRRKATQRNAQFRAINSEYVPEETTTQRFSVDLKVLGGSYQVDRVLAKIGPALSGEVAQQAADLIEATNARFGDAVINGDSAVDAQSFDGLSKALAGSTTETLDNYDWSSFASADAGMQVFDDLDEILALMSGEPTAIISNKRVLAKIASAARRASMYTQAPGPAGTTIATYGNLRLIDGGTKAGSNDEVIPVTNGTAPLYAVRFALDGFHGVSTAGGQLVQQWAPDFSTPGAVKTGEAELGPIGVVLKATKAAAVARSIQVGPITT